MKQLLYIVIFLLTTLYGQSQVIRQNGVTYRYNGKNPRTPIGGVYIKPITAANGVVSEESSGTFTLALDNLKMGSRIGDVRVTKQGMMVFNQQAVDEWSVRKDPLCLILCVNNDLLGFLVDIRNMLLVLGELLISLVHRIVSLLKFVFEHFLTCGKRFLYWLKQEQSH